LIIKVVFIVRYIVMPIATPSSKATLQLSEPNDAVACDEEREDAL